MPEPKLDGFSYKQAKGLECPFCVSTNMACLGPADRDDAEDGEHYLVMECHDCGELHHAKLAVIGWKYEPENEPDKPVEPVVEALPEWRVKFAEVPTNYNQSQIKFVRAATEDDAKALITDYVERNIGMGRFVIQECSKVEAALPKGQVL